MKTKEPYYSPRKSTENVPGSISRRQLLKGAGGLAGLILAPKAISIVGDSLFITDAETAEAIRRLDEHEALAYEKTAREHTAKTLEANKAKHIKDVQTDSGMLIEVFQTQTGWNPKVPIDVNAQAMNESINFLVGAMAKINEANGSPIDKQHIANIQDKAKAGKLNIDMTVIMSATTAFHAEDGHEIGASGNSTNLLEHNGHDPRSTILPLISFAPNIYQPGLEILTPQPSEGRFPKDDTKDMASFQPDAAQSLTAFFAHETSHVLLDAIGNYYTRGLSRLDHGNHDAGDFAHKSFVLPLSWYHNGALAGQIQGQPQLSPSFVVPDLTHVKM